MESMIRRHRSWDTYLKEPAPDKFKLLVVMDTVYVLIALADTFDPWDTQRILTYSNYSVFDRANPEHVKSSLYKNLLKQPRLEESETNQPPKHLFESGRFLRDKGHFYEQVCKKSGHPVLIFAGTDQVRKGNTWQHIAKIERKIPVLADYKFGAVREATQLYQDLSYFMGNTIHPSPDLAPPVQVSDKDRIVQHGFDLRQSFRHRKD